MADPKQFLDLNGLAFLWDKIAGVFVKKEGTKVLSDNNYSDADKEKLSGLHNYTLPRATSGALGGVKVGTGLSIDGTGTLRANLDWGSITDAPSTLAGYGITDGATAAQLQEAENSISSLSSRVTNAANAASNASAAVTELSGTVTDMQTDVNSAVSTVNRSETMKLLEADEIPGTVQSVAFAQNGTITITHARGQETVRTDTVTFGTNTVTERRVLSTGQNLTIVTNTETLVTTTTYAETQAGG